MIATQTVARRDRAGRMLCALAISPERPASGLALAVALAASLALGTSAGADDAASEGEQIFSKQCATCHAAPAAGIEAKVKAGPMAGPEIPGALADREDAWVGQLLRHEVEAENGKKHPKRFQGSDEELAALIEWMRCLSAESAESAEDS